MALSEIRGEKRVTTPLRVGSLHFESDNIHSLQPMKQVWTSPRRRSTGTAIHFHELFHCGTFSIRQKSSLVEINPGAIDGMTEAAVQERYPEEYQRHQRNPYSHRYSRAEVSMMNGWKWKSISSMYQSYHDLALRLEPVLLELEREKDDVLIVAHPTVLRCIYAYLLDLPADQIPTIPIPEETVIELIPVAYGCKEKRYSLSKDSETTVS